MLKSQGKLIHYVLSYKIWNVSLGIWVTDVFVKSCKNNCSRISKQSLVEYYPPCSVFHNATRAAWPAMTHVETANLLTNSHMLLWRKLYEGTAPAVAPAGTRQFLSSEKWFFVRCTCGITVTFLPTFIDSPTPRISLGSGQRLVLWPLKTRLFNGYYKIWTNQFSSFHWAHS